MRLWKIVTKHLPVLYAEKSWPQFCLLLFCTCPWVNGRTWISPFVIFGTKHNRVWANLRWSKTVCMCAKAKKKAKNSKVKNSEGKNNLVYSNDVNFFMPQILSCKKVIIDNIILFSFKATNKEFWWTYDNICFLFGVWKPMEGRCWNLPTTCTSKSIWRTGQI